MTKKVVGKVEALRAFIWIHGARQAEYRKAIVRDRRTGRLAEVALTEFPPLVEADEGEHLVVTKGEKFFEDDPVVQALPAQFRAVAE